MQEVFKYMNDYVINSFLYGGDISYNDREFNAPTPFLFDEVSRNRESMFEVFFIQKESNKVVTYQYGFCIDSKGISEEWLSKSYKTSHEFKTIFYRNREENELDLSGISEKDRNNIETALEPETLIVSLGAKLKVGIFKKIRNWFLENRIIDFGNPIENYLESKYLPEGFAEDPNVRKDVVKYLSTFDDSIHTQIVFTSHDLWELSNNLLRRDKIWFTEKDSSGNSTLHSLADFKTSSGKKIRNDENLKDINTPTDLSVQFDSEESLSGGSFMQ